jgi:hypothetical protein
MKPRFQGYQLPFREASIPTFVVFFVDLTCKQAARRYINPFSHREARPQRASVAQLAEQLICNQPVVGSNPSAGSIIFKQTKGLFAVGASPTGRTRWK